VAALSHELRTPLTAIVGFAEAMRLRAFGPLDEKYVESAQTIEQAARHMLELIARLTGGPERRQFRTFDAAMALAEVRRLLQAQADASGVSLNAALPAGPMTVEADPLALKQIMINLVANALVATPRGGRVEVSIEAEGRNLVIEIADTGPGPAPNLAEGLGLTLVRALCAAHGGGFTLKNGEPSGALAVARLPILAAD
jgi:two-component system cell cycle sensor histidine kinase PleC